MTNTPFWDFDLNLVKHTIDKLGPRFDTRDVLDDPAMQKHHGVASMSQRERYTYRRTGGKVLSAFRAEHGIRQLARDEGRGRGSRWEKIVPS